jgi:drug/metabolite transporter (DMT)-like permease
MPLFVALIGAIVLRERFSAVRMSGLSFILAGAVSIACWHAEAWSTSRLFGDAFFLAAGFLWACFTVVMRQARPDPLHAAALVATASLVIYLPI